MFFPRTIRGFQNFSASGSIQPQQCTVDAVVSLFYSVLFCSIHSCFLFPCPFVREVVCALHITMQPISAASRDTKLIIHPGARRKQAQNALSVDRLRLAQQVTQGWLIPLTYGKVTDWYLNIEQAGECRIQWQGQSLLAMRPELVDAAHAYPLFPFALRLALRIAGIRQFVRLAKA